MDEELQSICLKNKWIVLIWNFILWNFHLKSGTFSCQACISADMQKASPVVCPAQAGDALDVKSH